MCILSRIDHFIQGLFQHAAPELPVPHKDNLNVSSVLFSVNEAEGLPYVLDMFVASA